MFGNRCEVVFGKQQRDKQAERQADQPHHDHRRCKIGCPGQHPGSCQTDDPAEESPPLTAGENLIDAQRVVEFVGDPRHVSAAHEREPHAPGDLRE